MRVVNNRCCKDRACWFVYDEGANEIISERFDTKAEATDELRRMRK
jgi:hypothetical protein